uniref:NADH-ubiquinone oxidoreductase chain 6 n=1 Tax=Chlorops oryzae TaxID=1046848 RepID=A0A8A5MAD1_9MUSC|nr:NADH dehydrogenase subunit 6 [Chlorops oryzae]QTF87846.1 NADH dehydrogenase subunit 6 [Chlorops oryzae]
MIQFVYMMTFVLSLIFMQISHPLAMGLTLLIQTILISTLSGLITKTFWFSYILFLVFLGGMLILFIYVTALASNEMFSFSFKLMMYSMSLILLLMMIMYMFMDNMIMNINIFNNEMNFSYNETDFSKENSLNLNKLYNYPTNFMTILLMNYLLITLIAIVKITKLFHGPIRTMN